MMPAACPTCGTQTDPGVACVSCGTPIPAEVDADDSASGYASYWLGIRDRLREVAAPKYVVSDVLGYGGMAGVYLAEEPRLGRRVAIKVMSPALMMDPKLVDRFVQEARTIALLNHPNIVTIYEVDERDGLHWFTMTYVAGRTLGHVMMDTVAPLPVGVVRAWLYQIGDALDYAHKNGVVHRDIKPGNVLLDPRGNALVTDFGIAKVADGEAGLTRTGMLVGTPTYMSPEQCSSGEVHGASDQYSLGAVVYQMLTGQPPFAGQTLAVLQAHVTQQPAHILDLRPECPPELAETVHRMLEKRPADRWPNLSAAITAAGATPPGLDDDVRDQLERLAAPAAAITLAAPADAIREGERVDLAVRVTDSAGREVSGRRLEWSASPPAVAAVSGGLLSACSPGTAWLTVSCGDVQTSISVTVVADPVGAVEVLPTERSVAIGGDAALAAEVRDLDGTRLDDRAVLWSSSDPAIARVSSDGVVTGVAPGNAVIAARTGGRYAASTITVTTDVAAPKVVTPPPRRTGESRAPTTGSRAAAAAGSTADAARGPNGRSGRCRGCRIDVTPATGAGGCRAPGRRPEWRGPGAAAGAAGRARRVPCTAGRRPARGGRGWRHGRRRRVADSGGGHWRRG
jgi:eukaryotic-like serine/threonine-protein kinase